jgi:hypothetical protein
LIRLGLSLQDKLTNRRNGGVALAPDLGDANWRPIAEQVTKEMKPTKLAILLAQLCHVLAERDQLQEHQTESDFVFFGDAPSVFFS